MRWPRIRLGTLALLVITCGLAAAIVAERHRSAARQVAHEKEIASLNAKIAQLTPPRQWSGYGEVKLIGDRLVVLFQPSIYEREPGGKYTWWFRVTPFDDRLRPIVERKFDREHPVMEGQFTRETHMEVIDQSLPPGRYWFEFGMDVYKKGENGRYRWDSLGGNGSTIDVPEKPAAGK